MTVGGFAVKKTLLAVLLVSFVIVVGCTPPPAPPKPASITKAEAESLLKPVFAAANGGWRQADRSKVESATLTAFALKDAFARDVGPYASTMDELDRRHGLDSEPVEMSMYYDGLGTRLVQGLGATRLAIEAKDDAGAFEVAWSFPPEGGVEGGPDYTPEQEALAGLLGNYLLPAESTAANAIKYSVEPSNTVAVTFAVPEWAAERATTWTLRYVAEQRDGQWRITGIADIAEMLRRWDDEAVAYHQQKAQKARQKPTPEEVLAALKGEKPPVDTPDERTLDHKVGPIVQGSDGTWWAAASYTMQFSKGDGEWGGHGWCTIMHLTAEGWNVGDPGNGLYRRAGVPDDVVAKFTKAGVQFED